MGKDYSVGYGKPPSEHQFEKGKSGNPRGRPRKRPRYAPDEPLDFRRSLIAELQSKMTIVENGKKKQIARMDVINKVLVARAAQGDKTAMRQLLSFVQALPEELFVDRGNEVYEYWMARVRKEAQEQFLAACEKYEYLIKSPDDSAPFGNTGSRSLSSAAANVLAQTMGMKSSGSRGSNGGRC